MQQEDTIADCRDEDGRPRFASVSRPATRVDCHQFLVSTVCSSGGRYVCSSCSLVTAPGSTGNILVWNGTLPLERMGSQNFRRESAMGSEADPDAQKRPSCDLPFVCELTVEYPCNSHNSSDPRGTSTTGVYGATTVRSGEKRPLNPVEIDTFGIAPSRPF